MQTIHESREDQISRVLKSYISLLLQCPMIFIIQAALKAGHLRVSNPDMLKYLDRLSHIILDYSEDCDTLLDLIEHSLNNNICVDYTVIQLAMDYHEYNIIYELINMGSYFAINSINDYLQENRLEKLIEVLEQPFE